MIPPDIQVRLLLSIDRRQSAEEALDTARLAVRLKDEGVAGLDLSGNPSIGQVGGICARHNLLGSVLTRRQICDLSGNPSVGQVCAENRCKGIPPVGWRCDRKSLGLD